MRDGQTRKLGAINNGEGDLFAASAKSWKVSVVTLSGHAEGTEYLLEERRIIRRPLPDPTRRRHRALGSTRFRFRELPRAGR